MVVHEGTASTGEIRPKASSTFWTSAPEVSWGATPDLGEPQATSRHAAGSQRPNIAGILVTMLDQFRNVTRRVCIIEPLVAVQVCQHPTSDAFSGHLMFCLLQHCSFLEYKPETYAAYTNST